MTNLPSVRIRKGSLYVPNRIEKLARSVSSYYKKGCMSCSALSRLSGSSHSRGLELWTCISVHFCISNELFFSWKSSFCWINKITSPQLWLCMYLRCLGFSALVWFYDSAGNTNYFSAYYTSIQQIFQTYISICPVCGYIRKMMQCHIMVLFIKYTVS